MNTLKGNQLSLAEQRYALGAFTQRFTREHKPAWSKQPWRDGKPYPVQFASDADWLAYTDFFVTRTGKVSRHVSYCESRPTWPDNPELRPQLAA